MRAILPSLLALLLLARSAPAHPHESPSLWVDLVITQEEIVVIVSSEVSELGVWGLDPAGLVETMDSEAIAAVLATVAAHLDSRGLLRVDGAPAPLSGRSLVPPKDPQGIEQIGYLSFTFVVRCERAPGTVTLRWEEFGLADWQGETVLPGLVKVPPQVDSFALTPEEPEFTWHAPVAGLGPAHRLRTTGPRTAERQIPVLALALCAVALVLLLRAYRRPLQGVVAILILLSAFGLRERGVYTWMPRVARPGPAQAEEIFRTLQENLYAAFEAPTEEGIYDLLAASVEQKALDPLYVEIRESLILREEGGAIASIERIEPMETHIEFPGGEAPLFDAHWKWRAHCSVSHWGHTHERVNAYDANFRIAHSDGAWRIRSFELLDRERVEPD